MSARCRLRAGRKARRRGSAPAALALLAVMALAAPTPLAAQEPPSPGAASDAAPDSTAIRAAALHYIEGWYEGDAERMRRAVHPDLVKRIVRPWGGRSGLQEMGADDLVDATRRGGGRSTPVERRRTDVRILDIFGAAASVRVDAGVWIDYLHLGRIDGEWRIVNVLWELRARG